VGQPGRSVGAGWSGKHSIRASDLVATGAVIAVVELSVAVGGGPGTGPLNARAYIIGAVISLPTLVRRRWPPRVLIATAVIMILYYLFARRNISPAPVMMLPAYETALAGYLAWAIAVPSLMMLAGVIFLSATGGMTPVDLASNFLPSVVLFVLAVALGDVLRSRRALAAETAVRLRIAEAERESEAGRRVTEERLRIARELHDTVAHSMATITVQAGSALLKEPAGPVRESLESIRRTSKDALTEMRAVLGQLRADRGSGPDGPDHGLDRLESLRDAVTAAGDQVALPSAVDHAAYRILQESLTNVLRHAPSGTPASVCLRYQPDRLVITVDSDSGLATTATAGSGNGITGMTERAASVGGSLDAGRADSGGFRVTATLLLQEAT
jgi:signal transduction histidine kinase